MDRHCNLRDQHRRAVHSAKWTRGLDWLHETLRPITFRLLPAEIADRRGCWQEGYGFWGMPILNCISSLVCASTALAQHTLMTVPK
jgi:hypothetical protein